MSDPHILFEPIKYLEFEDVHPNGNLIHPMLASANTVICMIQANFCGYCTEAKPAFQKFADKNRDIICVTVQGDAKDDRGNRINEELITKLMGDRDFGYPTYIKYVHGERQHDEIEDRTIKGLEKFANIRNQYY